MKRHIGWSYAPYKPLFFDSGDIYICRLVPDEASIRLEWLALEEAAVYQIFLRLRDRGDFVKAGETTETFFDLKGLETESEYEFYVEAAGKRSRTRLARTGKVVGSVVNYLHPDDKVYSFSGQYLCSPSLVRHPEGYLLSSMDVYQGDAPQCLTLIFRSDDNGATWHYVSELYPSFWGKMFIHKGELYMLSCSTEYGDLLIGKSVDGGKNWTDPVILFHGRVGKRKNFLNGVHKNPQPVITFEGRIWNTMEWLYAEHFHAPMVMSAPVDADLLEPENWSFTEPITYNPEWEGVAKGETEGNIEGCLTVIDGKLYNIMRYGIGLANDPPYGLILSFKVDTENPEKALEYDRAIQFPCNRAKFEIKFDPVSRKYYSLASRITDPYLTVCDRRLLTLMVSDDAIHWSVLKDILDRRDAVPKEVGFQYVDFEFEGDDIIFLCRTALNEPHNYHDSNYQTFHRIQNFRDFLQTEGPLEIFHIER